MPSERLLPSLFLILLLAVLGAAAWQWHAGPPVSADLMTLVPGDSHDPLVQRAEQRMQEPLNRELLVLVGHTERSQALALSERLAQQWQASGLFEKVQWSLQTDLSALRTQLLQGRVALLSAADRQQLLEQPQAFIAQRVERLYDPFAGFSLVPNQDDWLGLTGLIQNSQPRPANVQLDTASGALVAEAEGKQWVLLRARTNGNAFDMQLPLQVADLLEASRAEATQAGAQLYAASGLLHAAHGQRQATQEITWVGGGATLGILLMLLLAFRRWQALLAFVPVLVGMLFGAVACVALFGKMHVMTLVLGSSLIGVAVDYPLHYLSKSWSLRPWRSWSAVRLTLPGLSLSLATSCIGYLALAFTPFPALTQIAAFSAAGLVGAYLSAVCLLPALLGRVELQPTAWPLRLAERLTGLRERLLRVVPSAVLLALLLAFTAAGLWQLHSRNDIRQWVGSPPQLLEEAQAVARITGYQPTSQFYLVRGDDQTQLLERLQALSGKLDELVALGKLKGYMSLSQLLASEPAQRQVQAAVAQLALHWQPLLDLGVPPAALNAEVQQLQELPLLDIDHVLAGPLGEAWRPLWLGQDGNGVAAVISLQGLGDVALLGLLTEDQPGVQLVDRLGDLNRLFAATQISAAELKLLSCALILLLLIVPFGFGGAARLVALPLLAALCSLACLGWLGQPLTLFSLFGLLLVTAISVDYAILMRERIGGAAVSLLGTLLAALTTWLSFGLLALSSTPAVSNFGLAVSLGLVFSFLLAPWAASPKDKAPASPEQKALP